MTLQRSKTLFQLCYPLLLNAALSLGVSLLDQMIISAYSDQAAAAVSIANQVLGVAYDFSALLGVGGVILVARQLGQGDEAGARRIASVAIAANAALSLLIALLLLPLGPLVLRWLNTPAEIVADARLYIHVIAAAMVFNGLLTAAVGVLRAFGEVKVILALGVLANVLYVALELLLIHGHGPVPGLGVLGSALATLLVRVVGVALLLWVLLRRLRLAWRSGLAAPAWWALLRRLFKLSLPSVLDNVAYGFYQLWLVSFIAGLGVATVLGRSYTLALTAFLSLVVMAISQGTEVLVGWRIGAGDDDGARRRALRSAVLAMLWSTALALLIWALARPLTGLFTADAQVHRLVRELLGWTILLQPVTALNTVLFHSLKASGDVLAPVLASQLVMWGVGLPLAWWLTQQLGLGVVGLWQVFILEETLKSLYMLQRWQRGRWRGRMAPGNADTSGGPQPGHQATAAGA